MTDDNVFHAGSDKHVCGHFAGVGAGRFEVDVFGADLDVGALRCFHSGGDVNIRDTQHDVAVSAGHKRLHLVDKRGGLGRGVVHFPVAGDNGFTKIFFHNQ